jgi:phospholipid N-methyltransferase
MTTHLTRPAVSPPRSGSALFLREFVRSPLTTASIVASATALARQMIEPLNRLDTPNPVVLELGPGTGAFTRAIAAAAPTGTRQLAVELNPTMADYLAEHHPNVDVITGSAADLPSLLGGRGVNRVDLVVSGLPWQSFAGAHGPHLLMNIADLLARNGSYTQFTYAWTRWTPPARRQHRLLRHAFDRVDVSATVRQNFPPAFVYTCTAPRAVR